MAAIAGTLTGIAITAENHNAKQKGPVKSGPLFLTRLRASQIWHGRRCCVIEKRAPRLRRSSDSLLASHSPAGDFLMRRSFILAGVAVTMLVASFAGANAQQPMQRVQVGILECRGGSSIGSIVGSVTN